MENLVPILSQIDQRILIAIVVVAVIALVWSIVKKASKAAISLLIIAVITGAGIPTVDSLQENYGVAYDKVTSEITFKIDGKPASLNIKEINNAKNVSIIFERGMSSSSVHVSYVKKDGTMVSETGSNATKLPNYMAEILKQYLDKAGIQYKTMTNTDSVGIGG